ncbi:hypothetical protein YB2330_003015 [Saitoella coloradoensis]
MGDLWKLLSNVGMIRADEVNTWFQTVYGRAPPLMGGSNTESASMFELSRARFGDACVEYKHNAVSYVGLKYQPPDGDKKWYRNPRKVQEAVQLQARFPGASNLMVMGNSLSHLSVNMLHEKKVATMVFTVRSTKNELYKIEELKKANGLGRSQITYLVTLTGPADRFRFSPVDHHPGGSGPGAGMEVAVVEGEEAPEPQPQPRLNPQTHTQSQAGPQAAPQPQNLQKTISETVTAVGSVPQRSQWEERAVLGRVTGASSDFSLSAELGYTFSGGYD